MVFTFSAGARAADKEAPAQIDSKATDTGAAHKHKGKEVSLQGDLGCAKCNFKTAKECQNVLKVTDGGKDTLYYLAANTVSKENHEAVCSGTKPAMVKGVLSEEGKGTNKKKVLTASEIKFQ
ncbi:MAG TPA: DUF6370 family protein [Polyangia bacterium]|jgi:hypothetical protein|nr:DUF6370 family protein [Polyangia bacterium]